VAERVTPNGPASPDRRKVLLALGFGAVNVVALSQLAGTTPETSPDGPTGPALGTGDQAAATEEPPALADAADEPAAGHVFDTVIANGRVIDPESGFDRVAHVGIDGTAVAAVSLNPLQGRRTIDASNRVVAPGFIDLLSYDPNPYGIWYKVGDGVTTNLGMHGINGVAKDWFALYESQGSPCHYGGAYDNPFMRGQFGIGSGESASAAEIEQLVADATQQLADGWIGIDFEPEYTPGIEFEEIRRLAEVAVAHDVPCFFHGRYSDMTPPGTNVETLDEILRVARETKAAVHVEHIISTGGTFSMAQSLETLTRAQEDEGIDVTACMYPYDFWATYIQSPRFDEGWQERFRISYDQLVVAGTGEHLTESTFNQYRNGDDNVLVAAFAIPEDDVQLALRSPFVMIGSDAILEPGNNNHPRSTGCFSRTLGHYVRDLGVLTLPQALAKMTILPAKRLEKNVSALRKKGRLRRGADADVTVFDPATVGDRSTIENPAQYSAGIEWVLVLGNVVKTPDGPQQDVVPGTAIKGDFAG
jgi:N-acyl-D-aspartate/D-glutamate deacylase